MDRQPWPMSTFFRHYMDRVGFGVTFNLATFILFVALIVWSLRGPWWMTALYAAAALLTGHLGWREARRLDRVRQLRLRAIAIVDELRAQDPLWPARQQLSVIKDALESSIRP